MIPHFRDEETELESREPTEAELNTSVQRNQILNLGNFTAEPALYHCHGCIPSEQNVGVNTTIALKIEFNQFDAVNPSIALITVVSKALPRLKVLFIVLYMFIMIAILNLSQ